MGMRYSAHAQRHAHSCEWCAALRLYVRGGNVPGVTDFSWDLLGHRSYDPSNTKTSWDHDPGTTNQFTQDRTMIPAVFPGQRHLCALVGMPPSCPRGGDQDAKT